MTRPQTPESGVADANPAALLIQLELLGCRAHELDEQLRDLSDFAHQHGDLKPILQLRRCAGVVRRASVALRSEDLHDAVRAAAMYLPLPKSTAGRS